MYAYLNDVFDNTWKCGTYSLEVVRYQQMVGPLQIQWWLRQGYGFMRLALEGLIYDRIVRSSSYWTGVSTADMRQYLTNVIGILEGFFCNNSEK